MIEKERIEEARRNVKIYIDDGLLKTSDKDAELVVRCRLSNSELSSANVKLMPSHHPAKILKRSRK